MEININLDSLKKVPGECERLLDSAKDAIATLKEQVPSKMDAVRDAVERLTRK